MKFHGYKSFCAMAVLLLTAAAARAQSPVDPALPVYQRAEGLKGTITLAGSDTISQVASIWGSSFEQLYPEVKVNVEVRGSANAAASVVNGTADFGLLSRQITEQEVKAFHDKFGYLPTVLTPALESIAIYVHKDNPIESLTLTQLDAIFSKSLKRGAAKTAMTWGDLGVTGKWAAVPIACQGRKNDTGSQVYFQTAILGGGEFRTDIGQHASNLDLVKAISADQRSVGFAGTIHAIPEVKTVPIAWREGTPAVDIATQGYPLVRPLQVIVNNPPEGQMAAPQKEFLKFVFSQRGQQDVILGGFIPVTARPAQIALDAIGVKTLN
jgi:phosphate transport system substrate-binding protein